MPPRVQDLEPRPLACEEVEASGGDPAQVGSDGEEQGDLPAAGAPELCPPPTPRRWKPIPGRRRRRRSQSRPATQVVAPLSQSRESGPGPTSKVPGEVNTPPRRRLKSPALRKANAVRAGVTTYDCSPGIMEVKNRKPLSSSTLVLRIHSPWPSRTVNGISRRRSASSLAPSTGGALVLPWRGKGLRLGSLAVPSPEGAVALPGGESMADHARKLRAGPAGQKPPGPQLAPPWPPPPYQGLPYPPPPGPKGWKLGPPCPPPPWPLG